MTLTNGDHLVLKRKGVIFTPDVGEAYHEFEVMGLPQPIGKSDIGKARLF